MGRIIFLLIISVAAVSLPEASAQNAAIKSNLLSDAFLNPNAAAEVRLAPKWTLDVSTQINLWSVNDHYWKHWALQPEARYWLCDTFAGHFFGVHAMAGQYNVGNLDFDFKFLGTDFSKLKDSRYQGWFGGLGIAYGYDWCLSENWNLEAELGIGWTYTLYDRYPCTECGTKLEEKHPHNYFGVTKAAISLVYVF